MKALKKYIVLFAVVAVLAATVLGASATDAKVAAVRGMDAMPTHWDPLESATSEQKFLRDLTGGGLYRLSSDGKDIYSSLASMPEDVTAEYAGTYGVPETSVRGYAYRITFNTGACWDDGTPITADDWIYSAQRILTLKSNETLQILANAEGFRNGGTHNPQMISLAEAGYGSVAAAQEAGISDFYVDVESYWGLGDGWRSIGDITRIKDYAMTQGCAEMYISAAWLYNRYLADERPYAYHQSEFVGIAGEGTPLNMEDVGLVKTGDYEMVLILEHPETASSLAAKLTEFCLFRQGCTYRTAAKSASYGPYRVAEVAPECIRLEKNPNWWGEAGQYDEILCR